MEESLMTIDEFLKRPNSTITLGGYFLMYDTKHKKYVIIQLNSLHVVSSLFSLPESLSKLTNKDLED